MTALVTILKRTIIGGIFFLLPLGIAVFALKELFQFALPLADRIQEVVLPGLDMPVISILLALTGLATLAFVAGLLAATRLGKVVFVRAEALGSSLVPGYAMVRQMVADMSGSAAMLEENKKVRVVRLDHAGISRLCVVVEELDSGEVVLFVPSSPSAMSGSVLLVRADMVADVPLSLKQLTGCMKNLGHGLGVLDRPESGSEPEPEPEPEPGRHDT